MENLHIVIGHLGDHPKSAFLPNNGEHKVTFSVASNESWKDRATGETKESVEWHNIEAWGKMAEICAKHLTKGRLVYVRGSHHTQSWESEGQRHSRNFIKARKVKFLNKK